MQKWIGLPTLVAVSGGPDSVALLRAMHAAMTMSPESESVRLIVGHVNHGIRGVDAQGDAGFVRDLAKELSLEFSLGGVDPNDSIGKEIPVSEESLRDFRYDALVEMASKAGARYIVMGHNADDQVETILFRILRGTGISGLAGIPKQRLANDSVTIVRPLLSESRKSIIEYLKQRGQLYCTDESNSDSNYTRNYLRNELIPEIERRFPAAVSSLARLGIQAKETNEFIGSQTAILRESIVRMAEDKIEFDCRKLTNHSSILVRQFLLQLWREQNWPRQSMTFEWWGKLARAMIGPDCEMVLNLPSDYRFERSGHVAVIRSG